MRRDEAVALTWHGHSDAESRALTEVARCAATADRAGLRAIHDRVFGALATALVEGRITGRGFERRFLELWRRYRDSRVAVSASVDALFTDVDAYCPDPELWEEGDLDDEGLRAAAAAFLDGSR